MADLKQETTSPTKNYVNVHETDIEIAFGKFAKSGFDRFEEFCKTVFSNYRIIRFLLLIKPVLANLASAEY